MNKFLLSLAVVVSSFLLLDAQAFRLRGCTLTNSNQCKDPDRFGVQLKKGCADASSNCRLKFCKANCIDIVQTGEGNDFTERKVLHLCKKNCLDNALLVRLDRNSREAIYNNFFPSEGRSGKRARKYAKLAAQKELGVLQAKGKQWWRFGRKPKNIGLYNKLQAEYQRLIGEKVRKLEAAKARGDRRASAKLTRDVTRLVAEATEALVPAEPALQPDVDQRVSSDASDSNLGDVVKSPSREEEGLTSRQQSLAKKSLDKWWGTVKGKKEASRIAQERASVAQDLIASTGAPSEVAEKATDMAGEWREGENGKYFVPNPPPLPGQTMAEQEAPAIAKISEALKDSADEELSAFAPPPPPPPLPPENPTFSRLSGVKPTPFPKPDHISPAGSKRTSVVSGEEEDSGEAAFAPPPPPPPPLMGSENGARGRLLSDLNTDNPLARLKKRGSSVDSARSSTSGNDRGALLAQIQQGKKLRPVQNDGSAAPQKPAPRTGLAAGINQILARRAAIAGHDDDDDDDNKSDADDDEWE